MNGLMAFPNLVGLVGLSAIIVSETNKYFYKRQK
jgi:AGCS family alanine or glycine:cation symporter